MTRSLLLLVSTVVVIIIIVGYFSIHSLLTPTTRTLLLHNWLSQPQDHRDWAIKANDRCLNAPFNLPTSGYIGYLWGDNFRIGHKHQGIDIFAGTLSGETPVYSVYAGYLTRQPDWKSSIIIRIPEDPLSPNRQIWLYYTHMADENGASYISKAFPQGTNEVRIPAGTLLGYQGNYSGEPGQPTGIHLHFSIVQSNAMGHYKNELDIANTIDPTPYFGLPLNGQTNHGEIPTCIDVLR